MSELKREYDLTLTIPGLASTGGGPARSRKKYKAPTREDPTRDRAGFASTGGGPARSRKKYKAPTREDPCSDLMGLVPFPVRKFGIGQSNFPSQVVDWSCIPASSSLTMPQVPAQPRSDLTRSDLMSLIPCPDFLFGKSHRPTAGRWLDDAAAPTPLISTDPLRCLVLDNDETTGDYQLGSLLFSMYQEFHPYDDPHQHFITKYLVNLRGARPGTKELLKMAFGLKEEGKLDHIVLFTAASNATGWVTFLAECLADYAEIPRTAISRVVAKEDCPGQSSLSGGRIVKDLRLICTDASNVIIVEDKPEFVRGTTAGDGGGVNGSCIHVGEYFAPSMNIGDLVEAMPLSEAQMAIAREALNKDAEKYPRINAATHRHANMELYSVINKVMSIYT